MADAKPLWTQLWQGSLSLLLVLVLCFAVGLGYGACKAGATVAYRILSGDR